MNICNYLIHNINPNLQYYYKQIFLPLDIEWQIFVKLCIKENHLRLK